LPTASTHNDAAAAAALGLSGLPPPLPNNTCAPLLDGSILDSDNSAIDGTNKAAALAAAAATSEDDDEDDAATAVDGRVKCCIKKCPHLSHELTNCAFEGCNKSLHHHCYTLIIKASTKALVPYIDKVFCTIKHHNDYTKNNRNVDYSWTNYGPGGRDDPHHSEFRLINILSTGDNYNKFRQPPGALTKIKICAQWGDEIFGTGVKVH
jgi:hypothetical protein